MKNMHKAIDFAAFQAAAIGKAALVAICTVAMSVQGASFKSEIALLPGEVWWGGGGGDGQDQPYGLKDSRRIRIRGAST